MSKLDVIVPLRDHQRFLLTPLTKFAFTQTSTINSKLVSKVEVILPFGYMKLQIRLKYSQTNIQPYLSKGSFHTLRG